MVRWKAPERERLLFPSQTVVSTHRSRRSAPPGRNRPTGRYRGARTPSPVGSGQNAFGAAGTPSCRSVGGRHGQPAWSGRTRGRPTGAPSTERRGPALTIGRPDVDRYEGSPERIITSGNSSAVSRGAPIGCRSTARSKRMGEDGVLSSINPSPSSGSVVHAGVGRTFGGVPSYLAYPRITLSRSPSGRTTPSEESPFRSPPHRAA